MNRLKHTLIIALTAVAGAACGDSPTGISAQDLEGTWNATQYVFTNDANAAEQVDIVVLGASFEMTVSADGSVSTLFDDGQGGSSSDSGAHNADGTVLTIAGNAFEADRSGDVLVLIDLTNEYDFDTDGSDDPASLTVRLVRQ